MVSLYLTGLPSIYLQRYFKKLVRLGTWPMDKMPMPHMGVPGFHSWLWLLIPASRQCRPSEAQDDDGSSMWVSLTHLHRSPLLNSWPPFLAPAIVDLWGVNQRIDSSSLCLLSFLLPPLELRRKKKLFVENGIKRSFIFDAKIFETYAHFIICILHKVFEDP